jgi:hypothetical protein
LLPDVLTRSVHEGFGAAERRLLELKGAHSAARTLGAQRLLEALLPANKNRRGHPTRGLELIRELPDPIRQLLLGRIDQVVERLVGAGNLGSSGFANWAALLDEALSNRAIGAVDAAAASLNHAFEHTSFDASSLVRTAFPPVYDAVISARPLPTMFIFFDWDRGKALRVSLIDAFLNSKWRPGDLLRTALAAGIGHRILKRLERMPSGKRYISKMKKDLASDRTPEAREAMLCLQQFSKRPPDDDEWD